MIKHNETKRVKGIVHWFNDAKGYGMVRKENSEEDIFVHYTAIETDGFKTLAEGQRIDFVSIKGAKGLQATEVRKEII